MLFMNIVKNALEGSAVTAPVKNSERIEVPFIRRLPDIEPWSSLIFRSCIWKTLSGRRKENRA